MGRKRDIVREFKDYYDQLSDDAKLIIHSILLVPKKTRTTQAANQRTPKVKKSSGIDSVPEIVGRGSEVEA